MVFLIIIFIAVILIGMSGVRNNNSTDVKTNNTNINYKTTVSEADTSEYNLIVERAVEFLDGFCRLKEYNPDFLGYAILQFYKNNGFKLECEVIITHIYGWQDASDTFKRFKDFNEAYEFMKTAMHTENMNYGYFNVDKYIFDEEDVKIKVVLGDYNPKHQKTISSEVVSKLSEKYSKSVFKVENYGVFVR